MRKEKRTEGREKERKNKKRMEREKKRTNCWMEKGRREENRDEER